MIFVKKIQKKIHHVWDRMIASILLRTDIDKLLGYEKYRNGIYTQRLNSTKCVENENCLFQDRVLHYFDACVVPGTDGVIVNRIIMSDRYKYDKKVETFFNSELVCGCSEQYTVINANRMVFLPGEYINLCYCGGKNIWHLVFDMISKYRIINEIHFQNGAKIILDEVLKDFDFAQNYLKYLNKMNYEIVYLAPDRIYNIEKCAVVTGAYFFFRGEKRCEDKFMIDKRFVRYLRGEMIPLLTKSQYHKNKFYIERGDERLLNEEQIKKYLSKKGFMIIKPELFGFFDELELFFNARCIVGSIGAAYTNTVFASDNCNIICICPKERVGLFDAYVEIAKETGANLHFCEARIIEDVGIGTPGMKFIANIRKLKQFIDN